MLQKRTLNDGNTKEVEFCFPLENLSNFWEALDMLLINCEVFSTLTWSKNCVLADMAAIIAGTQVNLPVIQAPTGVSFSVTDAKLSGSYFINWRW